MLRIIALLLLPGAANAESLCYPHDQFVETLIGKFGETLIVSGILPNEKTMEVFGNEWAGKKTWSVLITNESGLSCLVSAGDRLKVTLPGAPA